MNSLNLSEEVRRDTIDILHREEVTTRQLLTVITDEAKMLMPFFSFSCFTEWMDSVLKPTHLYALFKFRFLSARIQPLAAQFSLNAACAMREHVIVAL